MSIRYFAYVAVAMIGCGAVGASWYLASNPVDTQGPAIKFQEDLDWNTTPLAELSQLRFTDTDGNELQVENLLGEKSLVVVILRGNTGAVCPYCSTQTSRLIANYAEFSQRGAELLVVYPIEQSGDSALLDRFLLATRERLSEPEQKVPFPIAMDVGLTAVDELGIRDFLSKPATYILDKNGKVRFAYVGSSVADRPSIQAMLKQLDGLSP